MCHRKEFIPSAWFVVFVVVFCAVIVGGLGFLGGCWYSEGSSIGLEADTDKICVDGGLYKFTKAEAYFVHDYANARTFYVGHTQPIFHNRRVGGIGHVPLDKLVRIQSGEVLIEQPYDYYKELGERRERERLLEMLHRRRSECPKPELPSTFAPTSADKTAEHRWTPLGIVSGETLYQFPVAGR